MECRGLTLRRGGRTLVEGLSLLVLPGERWAVLGPNGAGKTSLLLALAGARAPEGGEVLLRGRKAAQCSAGELADARALLADRWVDPFSATVAEVVASARYRFGDEALAAERVQAALHSLDCEALAGRDVRSLSRGERQRVAIAAALVQQAPILLLDEPVSHQDPRHQALVLRRLAGASATIVAALHDINAALLLATHALLLTGEGAWTAGPAGEVLLPDALARLFGTAFSAVTVGGRRLLFADPAQPPA